MGSNSKRWKFLSWGLLTKDEGAEGVSVNRSDGILRRVLNLSTSVLQYLYPYFSASPLVASTKVLSLVSSNSNNDALPLEVLWEIFGRCQTLSPRDVLGFRAVCKTWRDAATSFLLSQNVFQVVLTTSYELRPEDVVFINNRLPSSPVLELTQLLSTSPAFPSTSIRFQANIEDEFYEELERTRAAAAAQDAQHSRKDLLRLFSLHASKMKSLALPCDFSAKALQNILYVLMPNLECLDMEKFSEFLNTEDDDEATILLCSQDSHLQKFLGLLDIILNQNFDFEPHHSKLFKELLKISPKLMRVHNVGISALKLLLAEKKSHLIYSFTCHPRREEISILREFAEVLKNPQQKPALRELTVGFSYTLQGLPDYPILLSVLNSILEATKDTLKFLSLSVIPRDFPIPGFKIKIPPMPKLVTIVLDEQFIMGEGYDARRVGWDKEFCHCIIFNNYSAGITATYDWNLFQFEGQENPQGRNNSKIPQNYFPCLRKVNLDVYRDIRSWEKLIGFFTLDRLGEVLEGAPPSVIPGDRILSVTELEMPCFLLGCDKLSKLFPNISSLKIPSPCLLGNSVWTTFPLLKKFEIYEDPVHDKKSTAAIDSFFTGIPADLCVRFLSEPTAGFSLSSAQVKLFRTEPYIGNCKNLTEFKIVFDNPLRTKYASKLSALYGLEEMSLQTRFIFSFKPLELDQKY